MCRSGLCTVTPAGRHDVAGGDGAGALLAHVHGDRLVLFGAHDQALEVQDDVGDVLLHPGNGGELVQHAVDADAGDSRARDRRQQRATQRVAEGVAEAGLERLDDELRAVVGDDLFGQRGSLRDEHWMFLLYGRPLFDAHDVEGAVRLRAARSRPGDSRRHAAPHFE